MNDINPLIGIDSIGDRLLVIYDGRCGLCNGAVRWLLRRDRDDRLRFVASESPLVASIVNDRRIVTPTTPGSASNAVPNSIVVVRNPNGPGQQTSTRSQALLDVLQELPAPWPAFAAVLRWIPRPIRDLGYRLIARFRYRIWGKLAACPIPTAEERRHFIDFPQ